MKKSCCTVGLLASVALLLMGCNSLPPEEEPVEKAATVESISGTDINRVTLTPEAAERLGIKTTIVREVALSGGRKTKVVPYAALIYDADGNAFVSTNPESLVFIRQAVTVDHIADDQVVLRTGPAAGTSVVTVGVSELYGIDAGVGGNE